MTLLFHRSLNTNSLSCDRGRSLTLGQSGAIGYFLIIFLTIVLLTAMGLFSSVKKGSEQGVFTRFHTKARMANQGAILEAQVSLASPWDISAAPTVYAVYVDTENLTTVTIDSVGAP